MKIESSIDRKVTGRFALTLFKAGAAAGIFRLAGLHKAVLQFESNCAPSALLRQGNAPSQLILLEIGHWASHILKKKLLKKYLKYPIGMSVRI